MPRMRHDDIVGASDGWEYRISMRDEPRRNATVLANHLCYASLLVHESARHNDSLRLVFTCLDSGTHLGDGNLNY